MNYLHGTDVLVGFEALADHYIVIRVNHVDANKLKEHLTAPPKPVDPVEQQKEMSQKKLIASLLPAASGIVNGVPKLVLNVALPYVHKVIKDYGVDATITSASVPPQQGGRSRSEFLPGAAAGAVLGTGLFWGGRVLYHKFKAK